MANAILFNGGGVGTESALLTATKADVLAGCQYIGYDTEDDIGIGAMPNNDAQTGIVDFDSSVIINEGYHNGKGIIRATNLTMSTATSSTVANNPDGSVNYFYSVDESGVRTLRQSDSSVRSFNYQHYSGTVTFYVRVKNYHYQSSGGTDWNCYVTGKFTVPSNLTFKELFGVIPSESSTYVRMNYVNLPSYAYPTAITEHSYSHWDYYPYVHFGYCNASSAAPIICTPFKSSTPDQIINNNFINSDSYKALGVHSTYSGTDSSGKISWNAYPQNGTTYSCTIFHG